MAGFRTGARRLAVTAGVTALTVATAMAANADTMSLDGDTGTSGPNAAFSLAKANCAASVTGQIQISYNGNEHFAPGEDVNVTFAVPAGSGITAATAASFDGKAPGEWGPGDSFSIPIVTRISGTPDSDANYKVEVTVANDDESVVVGTSGGNGKPQYGVTVDCVADGGNGGGGDVIVQNAAPVVNAGGPYAGAEGSSIALNGGSWQDTGDATTHASAWTIAASSVSPGTCSLANATSLTAATITCTDNGTATVQLAVTDGAATPLSGQATASVTISNAAPVVSAPTVSSATACSVTVSADYTDAGSADTHPTASINWGDGNTTTDPVSTEPGSSPGTVSGSHSYTGSAGTKSIIVAVTDDDAGAGSSSAMTSYATKNTASTFLAPINSGAGVPRSVFKLGSTIPVKITVTDCSSAPVSTLTPMVQLQKVDGVADGAVNEAAVSEVATNGKAMRWDTAQYIYNLSTKRSQFCATPAISGCTASDLTAGTYRLTVTDPSFFVNPTATFDLK